MKYTNLFVLVALLLASGCAQDTLTGVDTDVEADLAAVETIAKNEVKMIPVKGTFDGYSWPDLTRTDCPVGSVPLAGSGGGHSTLLGNYRLKTESCSYGQVDPSNPTFFGVDTLTAANGDKVYSTFTGYFTSPEDYVHMETITGGTGRFVHATGLLVAHGTSRLESDGAHLVATFEGEVSSVGSSKGAGSLLRAGKDEVKMVPLKGSLTGRSWVDPTRPGCPAGSIPISGEGSGEATYVGTFTMTAEFCLDPTSPTYSGTGSVVAANGDQIYTEYTGYSTSPTEYTQSEIIVGGTGRFENVSGNIVVHGTRGPDSFTATLAGEVSSVGSSR
jgi:hypothetical protein